MKLTEDFSIKKNKSENDIEYFFYNEDGILTDSKKKSCAEITKIGVRKIYKAFLTKDLRFFNPLEKSNFYSLSSKDKATGDSMFKLKEISEDAFNFYLNFLKTKQNSFLTTAERKVNS